MNEGFPKRSNEDVISDEPTHGERGEMVDDTTAPKDTRENDPHRPLVHAGQASRPFLKREVHKLGDRFIGKNRDARAQNEPKSGRRQGRKEVKPTEMLRQV